jgi:hypothetical protein
MRLAEQAGVFRSDVGDRTTAVRPDSNPEVAFSPGPIVLPIVDMRPVGADGFHLDGLPVDLQPQPDFLLLACRQAPHLGSVDPANQHVARNAFKGSIRFEVSASAVFIDLGRVSFAELRIESLGVTTDFLPRLLNTDGTVRLRNSTGPVRGNQNVFVNFRHVFRILSREPGRRVTPGGATPPQPSTSDFRDADRRRPTRGPLSGGLR